MSVWFEHPAHHGARLRGRSVVSAHLMASSTAELLAFAARLGLRAEWIQHRGEVKEHFDLMGQSRCDAAQAAGAELVDRREFVRRLQLRRQESAMKPGTLERLPADTPPDWSTAGRRARWAREQAGLTMGQAARSLGLRVSELSLCEVGAPGWQPWPIPDDLLVRMASLYGVAAAFIRDGDDSGNVAEGQP